MKSFDMNVATGNFGLHDVHDFLLPIAVVGIHTDTLSEILRDQLTTQLRLEHVIWSCRSFS